MLHPVVVVSRWRRSCDGVCPKGRVYSLQRDSEFALSVIVYNMYNTYNYIAMCVVGLEE